MDYQLVLTKADLVPPRQLAHRLQELSEELVRKWPRAHRVIHAISFRSPRALHALRCDLYECFMAPPPAAPYSAAKIVAQSSKEKGTDI